MTWPDLVNGAFEFGASLAILNHCRVLRRDRCLKGFSLGSVVFFTSWGLWNTFYYPHLGQIASFLGGLLVVSANAAYVTLALYYRRRAKQDQLELVEMILDPLPPTQAMLDAAQAYKDAVASGRLVIK